ncbi:TON1 Recruiting Motif 4, LONGIFOLIA 3 [Hibiscus trionum]|uniref:TON1 Recruiting Motif 4, LONGIFOLIA 3 n=1 Tax=Hibiscus trionum TaxID=183268 RepID=A0A9W7LR02_HIBTR|nr:TON1 Recruiting Motif 4, LONGIFOLIA 3 [Hibiscus trionum]
MAAKLLHSLADENPDLKKQIGCMTGVFQIFDRHHMITAKRLSHRKLPAAGNSRFNNGILEGDPNNVYQLHASIETNTERTVYEKQRISTESSRASFSSSCSSSMSSLDCNKIAQQEASSSDRILFPETPSWDTMMNQPSTSLHLGSQGIDLRDVVKDSMYREARGLSVKTTTREEVLGSTVKHRDLPRPFPIPNSMDGCYGVGFNGKQNVSADLKESLRVLAKLQEAPWYYNNEVRQLPRSSEANASWNSMSRDTPRFSYDGRETNRLSFESRDTFKSSPKLKEQPRLSLDSRERSMKGSKYLAKGFHNIDNLNGRVTNPPQPSGNQTRPPNIVAKLMGLGPLPDSSSAGDVQLGVVKTCSVEDNNPFLQPLRSNDPNRTTQTSNSTRSSLKDPTSPRWKSPNMIMKPISSSRFPIEPAPWRHADGIRGSQKQPLKHVKLPSKTPNSSPSVYSEIEKRLKDLEFKQSGKDLRALKQILEAMQAKGLLETGKEEQTANLVSERDSEPKCTSPGQNLRGQRSLQNTRINTSTTRGSDSTRTYESPIVIMKPAKLIEKGGMHASTVVPIDDISSLPKLRSGASVDNKRGSISSQSARDHTARSSQSTLAVSSTDKRASSRNVGSIQSSTKSPKESTTTSVKRSGGSRSPRLQQKKLELDRRSRPPTPPSDPNKPRRQSNRNISESSSPGGKRRPKSHNMQQCDEQLSQVSSESCTSSHQGDEISLQSDSNIALDSKFDMEVTSHERSIETNSSQSPSMNAAKYSTSGIMQKKSTSRLVEDGSVAELAMAAPEHPSPVSVLDTSVYRDDAPSPVKQILNIPEGAAEGFHDGHKDEQWNSADNCLSNSVGTGPVSEINRKKLQKIEYLVQKLRRLNSTHDEASTDYIASLCENANPDHRYISEILLASGLLLRDLGSGSTMLQLHPSGHPINPELFFVLEQTKASTLQSKEDSNSGKVSVLKPDHEKFHRKLIFDLVNEILVGKLALVGASPEAWINSGKLARKTLNAQKLLKELCTEIEHLQANKSNSNVEEEEDGLKNILWEDVMCRSESWTDFNGEISRMVLDVERLVFKDLVNEIVIGEGGNLRSHQQRRRRQLFSK